MIGRQQFPNPREGAVGVFLELDWVEWWRVILEDSDNGTKKAFGIRSRGFESGPLKMGIEGGGGFFNVLVSKQR